MELLRQAVRSLDRHKAEDLCVLRIAEVSSLAEYFVIAGGTSSTHVRALADYLQEELAREGEHPLRTEGYASGSWALLDYGRIVVHLFTPETREFYNLERLWQDGIPVPVDQLLDGSEQQ